MSLPRKLSTCFALFACATFVSGAFAQRYTGANISRPSTSSPSQLVGRIGGYGTRANGALADLGGNRSLQETADMFDVQLRRFGTGRAATRPNNFLGGRNGMRLDTRSFSRPIPSLANMNVGIRSQGIAQASGWRQATNFNITADRAFAINRTAPLRGAIMPAEESETSFHAFFGVSPASPKAIKEGAEPAQMLSAGMETEVQRRFDALRQRTLRRFAEGTASATPGPEELAALAEAQTMLEGLAEIERERGDILLLVFHAALARSQPGSAVSALNRAVARNSQVFVEQQQIARNFGDYDDARGVSEFFRRQMLQHRPLGDMNADSPAALTVTAYCSWALEDRERLRRTLDRYEMLADQSGARDAMRRLSDAFRAALQ